MYVPGGFVLLRDLKTGFCEMQPYGSIVGQYNMDIEYLVPSFLKKNDCCFFFELKQNAY